MPRALGDPVTPRRRSDDAGRISAQVGRGDETHQSGSAWISVVAGDIDALASAEYADGQDPIDVAVGRIAAMIDIRDDVVKARQENPRSYPRFGSTDNTVIGRRVVASLLDAGWHPPPATEITDAVERSAAIIARFTQWLDGLRPEQRTRALEHYSEQGDFPPDLRPPS